MLRHKGTQNLKTPRLELRRFCLDDAYEVFHHWANDKDVSIFMTWFPHENIENTSPILREWISNYEKEDYYNWGIVFEDKLIGNIYVSDYMKKDEKCQLSFCIGQAWWNQGIITEACNTIIDFLFQEVGFNRIMAKHVVENVGSGKVLEKCGMTLEGIERKGAKGMDGKFRDIAIRAILKEDKV